MTDYRVFGLKVRSEIELPELTEISGAGEPDVTIVRGPVNADPQLGDLQAQDGRVALIVPKVAQYRITDGCQITVDAEDGVPNANVRLYMLGSAFGVLLHQRRLLLLHANAVAMGGRAVAFVGESGAGKSTLAAWFHDRDYRVLADDVCAVDLSNGGVPTALPGIARLRLWREALVATGRDTADFQQSFIGDETLDKFDVPLRDVAEPAAALPLAAICLLQRGEAVELERISGVAAVEAVFANTYRGRFIAKVGSSRDHWTAAVSLAQRVPMLRLTRRWGLRHHDEEARAILSLVEDHLGESTD